MNHQLPFSDKVKKIILNKQNWRNCSPDNPPCGMCKNPIYEDVPIRLFNENNNTEIAFHPDCAFKEGTFAIEPESEDWIKGNMEMIFCFHCEDLDKCTFINKIYKGKKHDKKKEINRI